MGRSRAILFETSGGVLSHAGDATAGPEHSPVLCILPERIEIRLFAESWAKRVLVLFCWGFAWLRGLRAKFGCDSHGLPRTASTHPC
jgi:hypothetical protein